MIKESIKNPLKESNKTMAVASFQGHFSSLSFVYKKAERITTALHLVTKFITPNEPIRESLRVESVELLSDMFSDVTHPFFDDEWLDALTARSAKIVTFLEVAYRLGYISEMNWDILSKEYSQFPAILREARDDECVGALNKSFCHVSKEQTVGMEKAQHVYGGRQGIKDIKRTVSTGRQSSAGQALGSHGKKDVRRIAIIGLLKRKEKINVKDVTAIIDGYSEKTLQRELLSLVDEGVLKKEGERRWSMYSLR